MARETFGGGRRRSGLGLSLLCTALLALLVLAGGRLAHADESDPVDRARYAQASQLVAKKRFAEARSIARLLVTENPKWTHAWVLLGITYTGDPKTLDLAEDALEHAAKLDPKSPDPLRSLAAVASARKESDEAADYLLRAAQLAEDDLVLQTTAARALVAANRMAEAKQRYDIVLEAEPENIHAVSGYGSLLVDLGEYSRAIEIYRRALERGQHHIILYNNLVDALVRAARYQEAVEAANEALERKFDPFIAMHKVRALTHLGRLEEATTLAREVLESGQLQGEQAVFGWYQLGIAEALRGCGLETIEACQGDAAGKPECCAHMQAALEAFDKAHEIRPDFRDTIIRLGLAQFAAGKLEDAEATLKRYIAQKGDKVEAEAFGALAVTLYRFGEEADVQEAVRVYREARELAPDFDSAERLETFRLWPPYAIGITEKLRAMADEPGAAGADGGRGGCGCVAVAAGTTRHLPGALLGLWTVLGAMLLARRRRRSRHA